MWGGGMDACVCIKLVYVWGYLGMCAHEACMCRGIDAYV